MRGLLILCLGSLAWSLVGPFGSAPAGAATKREVLAAEYFGSGSPINMWNTDLSGARAAFSAMKSEGFNAVGLVIPWGGFQVGVQPVRYDNVAFSRLDRLIRLAGSLNMGVILRLGYEFDNNPSDQMPFTRFASVFSNNAVYRAWLDYISKIHQNVAHFSNIDHVYISWEDYWTPIYDATSASTLTDRQILATTSGYRTWLKSSYSLQQTDSLYGTHFASWAAVPTPSYSSPSFSLMYRYEDWALVHRLFEPAAARFPGLTMESRVDIDPIYTGTTVTGAFSHADTFDLPGTSFTGMYFSPYMDDPSSSPEETPAQAIAALQSTLSSMSTRAKGQPLFIYEYEFVSNSPAVANDPAIPPSQLPTFIQQSEPILRRYTIGYALWTFRDFNQSTLYNPSFTLGTSGWRVTGARSVSLPGGNTALTMASGGTANQTFSTAYLDPPPQTSQVTFTLQARSLRSSPTEVSVGVAGAPAQTISLSPTWQTYQIQVPASAVLNGSSTDPLMLHAQGSVQVTNLQLYAFSQVGDVMTTSGSPGVAAAALKTLNEQLASSSHAT